MLTEKIRVGNLEFANRLVMPPMATWQQGENGIPEQLVAYYAQRAGKLGMITVEFAYISQDGRNRPGQLSVATDADIPQLAHIANAIHGKGTTKAFLQINHAGSRGDYHVGDQADIDRIIQAFVDAALRAQKAGFDGVELHAAHGFLLNQFYSPLANTRTDGYSAATMEGRTRLTREVIQAVRAAVGKDYALSVRLGGCDYQAGGSTIQDAGEAARIYERAGVDMISISGGLNGASVKGNDSQGYFSDQSAWVKQCVSIPVLLTGGITTREAAEAVLAEGKADLIGVGRPLLKDAAVINAFLEQIPG